MTDFLPVPALHPTLLAIMDVSMDEITPFLLSRSATRKVQAAAARNLFKRLGLRGISVTAPNYSMASMVPIRLPRTEVGAELHQEWDKACNENLQASTARGQLRQQEYAAHHKLEAILGLAFPDHRDRSDVMTDYFDACWSIG